MGTAREVKVMKRFARRGLPVIVLLGLAGVSCTTYDSLEMPKRETEPFKEFFPVTFVSGIHHDKGSYSNLFSPESYAVWVGSDVAELRKAKALEKGGVDPKIEGAVKHITDNYIVLECHCISVFGDMSIAYDVVGLRGIEAYLLTPDGRKVDPIQVVVGSSASETPQEALRRFERTNLVIFQKRDLWTGTPTVKRSANAARLVLDGFDSSFYFEWPSVYAPPQPWIPKQDEYLKAIKTGFVETYERLGGTLHRFD